MHKHLLFYILFLLSFSAQSQDWQWVRSIGGPNFSESKRIALDADGNSYVLGNFAQGIRFGTNELTGSPDGEAFLTKYDTNGELKWVKQMGGTSAVEGVDLFADTNGNTFITGTFKGAITLGAYTLTSPDNKGTFVAKFDTNGNVLWATQAISSEGDVKGHNITVDQSGNTFITGNFFISATFGSTSIHATKDEQVFIAKYNSRGEIVWLKMAGGLGSCFTHSLTTDQAGNIFLAGEFWQTAVFGSTTLYKNDDITSPGEIFIAKYDASGNALWAKQAGGSGSDAAQGIAADNEGNIYLTGFFQKTVNFGNLILSGNEIGNFFLAKYSATGNVIWVKSHTSSGRAAGFGIKRDSKGALYVVGTFEGSMTMGLTPIVSAGDLDLFVAQYDGSGNVSTATNAGGSNRDEGKSLAVTDNNMVYLTGAYSGPAAFGSIALTSLKNENIVVGKIKMNPVSVPQTITTGAINTNLLCPGATVNVGFTTTGAFNPENSFLVQLSDENGNFFTPVLIGNGRTSPITANIPANVIVGNKYRIRVISESLAIIGTNNGNDLGIAGALRNPGIVMGSADVCVGATATYSILPVADATSYSWEVPVGWTIIEGQGTTILKVTAGPPSEGVIKITASNACQATLPSSLNVRSIVSSVTASVTSASIVAGSSTFLSAKGADTYTWSPVTGLSNPNAANPVATPVITTTYTVTGTKSGCTSTAKITITVKAATVPSDWVWANQGGNTSSIESTAMATDNIGNVYVTGYFYGTITLGNTTLISTGQREIFLVKYNASGIVLWAIQAGGAKDDHSRGLVTDAAGNIMITGYFGDASIGAYSGIPATADFGTIRLTSSSEHRDIFIAKYNSDGNILWAKRAGGMGLDEGYALATDATGNVYATGYFGGVADFGSQTISVNGGIGHDAFIVKYDATGNTIWARQAGGAGLEQGRSIAVDAAENIYVTGFFAGNPAYFDSITLTNFESWNKNYGDIFIVKYTPNGNAVWAKQVGGATFGASRVVVGKDESIFVMGSLLNTTTFGTSGISCKNGFFLARLNANGNVEWVKQPEWGEANGASMAIDDSNNVFITGSFDSSLAFGTTVLTSSLKKDAFVVNYNAAGNVVGATRAGGTGEDYGTSIATNLNNEVYVTGNFQKIADFGGNMSLLGPNEWENDFFVAKLRAVTPSVKPTITIGNVPAIFNTCSGEKLSISFTTTGLFNASNSFQAHLSDENGSFGAFYLLGTSLQSPIVATLPRTLKAGVGYKIKVIATAPYTSDEDNAKNIVFTTIPQPEKITGSLNPCPDQTLEYSITAVPEAVSYNWTIPAGWFFMQNPETSKIKVIAGTQPGFVSVSVTTACGTSAVKSLYVEPKMLIAPTVKIEADCDKNEVVLTANGAPAGGLYKWYTAATGGTPIAIANTYTAPPLGSPITYYVSVVSEGGCESPRTAVPVIVNSKPIVNAGPDKFVCLNESGFMLTDASPAGGQWTGKGISNGGYFSPASAGAGSHTLTYSITQNGCTVADTKTIIVNKAPAVTLGAFSEVCSTVRDYLLTGGQPVGGEYSGIGVKNGLFTPVDTIKNYTITYTYTDLNGCSAMVGQPLSVSTCTGIVESELASDFIVYPNPTKSAIQVVIPLPSATPLRLLLLDAKGKKLYEENYVKVQGEFKQIVNLRGKARGIYVLQLILKDGVITRRIVLE